MIGEFHSSFVNLRLGATWVAPSRLPLGLLASPVSRAGDGKQGQLKDEA